MRSKNRTKLFLENFLVYGFGGMISKLIPLLMLPVITRLYPSSEYLGLNDLSQTFTSFAQALALCGMYDAMFRIFFDYKDLRDQKSICSTALAFVSATTIVMTVLFVVFRKQISILYFKNAKYELLVVITIIGFFLSSTNTIVSAPTRIQNKRRVFLITNTLSSVLSYLIAIPLIKMEYYISAMPLAHILSVLSIEVIFIILNRKFFSYNAIDLKKLRPLLLIGLPLLPNFLIYWIYNSADKLMISHILSTDATGVYSVASRIGHISNLIYTAFAGGWSYFAFTTMNDEDQIQMKSNIYEYLAVISFSATVLLMGVSKIGFYIAFPSEYISGFVVAPYLFLSPLLLMLYQVAANQFTIIKKTYLNLVSLSVGAVLNIFLNYILINSIGIEGASIATIIGYIVSNVFCLICLLKLDLIKVNRNTIISSIIMLAYFLLWRFMFMNNYVLSFVSALIVELVYMFMYRDAIKKNIVCRLRKGGSR